MQIERQSSRHRIGRVVFAFAVGASIAVFSYRWITDPQPRARRAVEENVVTVSRQVLRSKIGAEYLEIVDPMSPNRKIGKAYIYWEEQRWSVSGFYRRNEADQWHPYLMDLSDTLELIEVKLNDKALVERAADDASITIL